MRYGYVKDKKMYLMPKIFHHQPHACESGQHRDATSSDINIEAKLHTSMTNWISSSDEAVFRLLHVVCDRCLYFLTTLKVTDEKSHQSPFKGVDGLGVCLTSIFQKGDKSLLECLNPGSPLFESERERPEWETPKEERKLEQCPKQHSTQDEHWGSLWNSCQDKKHPLLSTSKNNGSYLGERKMPFLSL